MEKSEKSGLGGFFSSIFSLPVKAVETVGALGGAAIGAVGQVGSAAIGAAGQIGSAAVGAVGDVAESAVAIPGHVLNQASNAVSDGLRGSEAAQADHNSVQLASGPMGADAARSRFRG